MTIAPAPTNPLDLIPGNAAIGQSGGPTAVINQSLVGVVEGLRAFGNAGRGGPITKVLGMRHGVSGLTKGDFHDLTETPQDFLDRLACSPSAGLGSTRDKPDAAYCERILEACKTHNIRYYFYVGGNDSSDTCRIVNELSTQSGYDLRCFHVPKTVDNDLMENDHTPGFASAARFVATACMADFLDNISLPGIKINVVMGRHAGFLANGIRRDRIAMIRRLLDSEAEPDQMAEEDPFTGADEEDQLQPCPKCGGTMRVIETFLRGQTPKSRAPPWEDAA